MPVGTPILVIVTLYGGNDGLNTVVPYLDPAYLSNRPEMSLDASEVIPLSDSLRAQRHDDRVRVTLGRRTSWRSCSARATRSPISRTSRRWRSGRPAHRSRRSRAAGSVATSTALPHDPFRAIGIDSTLTPLLAGNHRVGSMVPVSGLQVPTGLARDADATARRTRRSRTPSWSLTPPAPSATSSQLSATCRRYCRTRRRVRPRRSPNNSTSSAT